MVKQLIIILIFTVMPMLVYAHDLRGMEEPKTQAVYSNEDVKKFAQGAVIETMSFGFHDYKYRLQQSSRHFTKFGWASFVTALQKSSIIEVVEANQQVISVQVIGETVIESKGLADFLDDVKRNPGELSEKDRSRLEQAYHWVLKVPVELAYHQANKKRTDKMNVVVVIVRDHHKVKGRAIAINQWIAYPSKDD